MSRRVARESAIKVLYSLEFIDNGVENQLDFFKDTQLEEELSKSDEKYLSEIVNGVLDNKTFIDEKIEQHLRGWKITRISKIDLSILRLAIYEILIRSDVPVKVSINEAIEICKKYSTKESSSFINGVLGEVAKLKE